MVLSILTLDNLRHILMYVLCAIVAAISPTTGFVTALIIAWAFNLWCGMRADGVVIITCKNWSWKKFGHTCAELILFLTILWLVALITYFSGDADEGLYAVKTINYVFVWSYVQNGLKNLCKTHPKNKALWIIYLFVRFEFTKIVRIDNIIALYEEHLQKQEAYEGERTVNTND